MSEFESPGFQVRLLRIRAVREGDLDKLDALLPIPNEVLRPDEARIKVVRLAREVGRLMALSEIPPNIFIPMPPQTRKRFMRTEVMEQEPIVGWQLETNGITLAENVQDGVPIYSTIRIMLSATHINGLRFLGKTGPPNDPLAELYTLTEDNPRISDIIKYGVSKRQDGWPDALTHELARRVVDNDLDIWTND